MFIFDCGTLPCTPPGSTASVSGRQSRLKPTQVRTDLGLGRHNLDVEWHDLLFGRDHARDLLFLGELESCDPLKALLEMWLYPGRVLGLRQDLQQLVIGQEEEPMELWEMVGVK